MDVRLVGMRCPRPHQNLFFLIASLPQAPIKTTSASQRKYCRAQSISGRLERCFGVAAS